MDDKFDDKLSVGFGFTVISLVDDHPVDPEEVVWVKVTVAAVAVEILLAPVKTPVDELIDAILPSLGEILQVPVYISPPKSRVIFAPAQTEEGPSIAGSLCSVICLVF